MPIRDTFPWKWRLNQIRFIFSHNKSLVVRAGVGTTSPQCHLESMFCVPLPLSASFSDFIQGGCCSSWLFANTPGRKKEGVVLAVGFFPLMSAIKFFPRNSQLAFSFWLLDLQPELRHVATYSCETGKMSTQLLDSIVSSHGKHIGKWLLSWPNSSVYHDIISFPVSLGLDALGTRFLGA